MNKKNTDDAQHHLATVRREILTYCESMPGYIRANGSDAFGLTILSLGKCFLWVGPILDKYTLVQPLPGMPPLPRVTDLGEELRVIGLEMLHSPKRGEIHRTIEALEKQLSVLRKISKAQKEVA